MEARCVKGLGRGGTGDPETRRKRDASDSYLDGLCEESNDFLLKRRKLGGCNREGKQYSNFATSAPPARVLYREKGEWKDLPQSSVLAVREEFVTGKMIAEAVVDGRLVLFDFIRMLSIDLDNCAQHQIAWIDEKGNCFFPETLEQESLSLSGSDREINLNLEIGVSGNAHEPDKPPSPPCEANSEVKPDDDDDDVRPEEVRNLFLMLFNTSARPEFVGIYDSSSEFAVDRKEVFLKQVRMTRRLRGSANVYYAWFFPRADSAAVHPFYDKIYEMGVGAFCENKACVDGVRFHDVTRGCVGARLVSSRLDGDENGVRHAVMCRVITGRMKGLSPGLKRFSLFGEFDSGVDDLEDPTCYVLPLLNVNTHVFPQYMISFKLGRGESGGPVSSALLSRGGGGALKVPKQSWMPYTVLFSAFSHKISSDDMKLVHINYQLFQCGKINQWEFFQQLKLIVGDAALRSTILTLQARYLSSRPDAAADATRT